MKLDHVVWFSQRMPELIASQYDGAVVGGRHERWGTYNALKYTQNAYIEWLAIEDEDVAEASTHPLVMHLRHDLATYGEGWGTLCFSTNDMESLNHRLQQSGWATSGVLDASRRTSSSTLKKWKMLFIQEDNWNDLPAPFFIQWEEDEETRSDILRKEGTLSVENESERIIRCAFVAEDAERTVQQWSKWLGVSIIADNTFVLDGIEFSFLEDPAERNRMMMVETGQAKE